MKSITRKTLVVLCLVSFLATIAVAVAASGYLMTSNTATVIVTSQASLSLLVSQNSIVVNTGSITLTAVCTDKTYTGEVTFLANGETIDTVAAVAGVATLSWTPTAANTYSIVAIATHA